MSAAGPRHHAQSRDLARLTEPDIRHQLTRSRRILVPCGSTEQHGAHAPLGTDAMLAVEICQRVAPRVDALIAPTVPYGVSGEHEPAAGLISIQPSTLMAIVRDVAQSLARNGFDHIVFVNGHATNAAVLSAAVLEASERLPPDTALYWLSYWDALSGTEREGYLGQDAGLHANLGETSALLAVDPSLVDLERAKAEFPSLPDSLPAAALHAYLLAGRGVFRQIVPSGVWGDPTDATAERGRAYLDAIETAMVEALEATDALFDRFGRPRRG